MEKKEYRQVRELFICNCSDVEHQIIMSYFNDDSYPYVYCSIHLVPEKNIFKRIRNAVWYIFGHRCAYGDFEEFIFNTEDADRLQSVVDYLRLVEEKNENRMDNNVGKSHAK